VFDFFVCWLIRLEADSSLRLYEEMVKDQADLLPVHVARLHSLDSEKVIVFLLFIRPNSMHDIQTVAADD